MNELNNLSQFLVAPTRPGWTRSVRDLAQRMLAGELTFVFPKGRRLMLIGEKAGPAVTVEIHRFRAFWRAMAGGELGLAESFMDGEWSASDLVALMELALTTKAGFEWLVKIYASIDFINRHHSHPQPISRTRSSGRCRIKSRNRVDPSSQKHQVRVRLSKMRVRGHRSSKAASRMARLSPPQPPPRMTRSVSACMVDSWARRNAGKADSSMQRSVMPQRRPPQYGLAVAVESAWAVQLHEVPVGSNSRCASTFCANDDAREFHLARLPHCCKREAGQTIGLISLTEPWRPISLAPEFGAVRK